ncbi:MAG: imidazole glycerol phosphate synthase subunit HisH [Acidobacteria bacterium]|nr:imidazole glycerol phosphate synthase subunit HisH [Acidobacteriota bacterium]
MSPAPASGPAATPRRVTIVDAGVGNLGNLRRALEHLGAEAEITADPSRVASSSCLVLPGVGAFRPPRETLRGALEDALGEALDGGAWLLGICVGFQLLFEAGEEFGQSDGLGLLPGTVRRLPATVPLPHIGWNALVEAQEHPLLAGLAGAFVYFVHSFAPDGVPDDLVLARCRHGRAFPAVAGRGRVLGTQFHPEKSGKSGLALLDNYLEMAHGSASGH